MMESVSMANMRGFDRANMLRLSTPKEKRQYLKLVEHEEEMFKAKSRYTILALTLGYKDEYAHDIHLSDLSKHRSNLFYNNNDEILAGVQGHAWKYRYHPNKGYYMQLILYYDYKFRESDILTDCIGKYWVDKVTNGKGTYENNSNENNYTFKVTIGFFGGVTGFTDRKNKLKREKLTSNFVYIAYNDNEFEKKHPGVRQMGVSQTKSIKDDVWLNPRQAKVIKETIDELAKKYEGKLS
jgi:hypothetical protein